MTIIDEIAREDFKHKNAVVADHTRDSNNNNTTHDGGK